jgi:hypothetical protein
MFAPGLKARDQATRMVSETETAAICRCGDWQRSIRKWCEAMTLTGRHINQPPSQSEQQSAAGKRIDATWKKVK